MDVADSKIRLIERLQTRNLCIAQICELFASIEGVDPKTAIGEWLSVQRRTVAQMLSTIDTDGLVPIFNRGTVNSIAVNMQKALRALHPTLMDPEYSTDLQYTDDLMMYHFQYICQDVNHELARKCLSTISSLFWDSSHTKLERLAAWLESDFVFIPVASDGHWRLLILIQVDRSDPTLLLLDSLKPRFDDIDEKIQTIHTRLLAVNGNIKRPVQMRCAQQVSYKFVCFLTADNYV
jgi:hypothetical protein